MHVEKNARVAFQGERGAFSEEAAVKFLGEEITLVPRPTFESAFNAIADGAADYILAPIENSLAGSVHRSFDLLVDSPLNILAEVIIPIAHNLIAVPGAKFEEITVVESHPVALAQCEQFFSAHPRLETHRHRRYRRKRSRRGSPRATAREVPSRAGAPRTFTAARFCASTSRTIARTTRASSSFRNLPLPPRMPTSFRSSFSSITARALSTTRSSPSRGAISI